MTSLNKDGLPRKNATKGKVSVSLRLDAETKRFVDLAAWIRRGSFSSVIEKAAMEYLVNHPFTKREKELMKSVLEEHSKRKEVGPGSIVDSLRQYFQEMTVELAPKKTPGNKKTRNKPGS